MSRTKIKTNFVDDLVSYFSPEAGYRRDKFRMAQAMIRKYEANDTGRRLAGLMGNKGGANAEVGPAISRVRERVRELVRNNPHAGRAVGLLESHIVGTGIMAAIQNESTRRKANTLAIWNAWADSVDCDVDGNHNFYGLQALAARTMVESGECLILRRWRKESDGYKIPVPFQIQVLEGDFLDTTKEGATASGGRIVYGVEFNSKGRRIAYWIYNQHPGEKLYGNTGLASSRVDAKDVQHLFRVDRSGQVRGMSWGSSCVVRHHDLDAYEDAQLLRQKIASFFAGFVQDMESPETTSTAEAQFAEQIEPGAIELLPPGKSIVFPNVPTVSNDGHQERVLRSIAMGWGVSYEALTGDFSGVNYSSGRMGLLDLKRNLVKWQWHTFIPRFNMPVFAWFLDACEVQGLDAKGSTALWTPPKFEMIDPTKEIPATITAIRGGLQSLPEAIREQGKDFEQHLAEIAESNKALDAKDILLDSDPRKVMKAGMLQSPTAQELTPDEPAPAASGGE